MLTMNSLLIIILFTLQITVNGWVAIIPNNPKLDHHGYDCFTNDYKLGGLNKGEEKRAEGECVLASCDRNGDISLSGCGVVAVEPPCYVAPGDLSKPYPDCCFEIKCLDSNTVKPKH